MALDTIELFIDEDNVDDGISAISFVEHPAIEENWVALSKSQEVQFKAIDEEKRIVVGLALVPDKEIYRRRGEYEYNVMFTKETVRKASHLYLKQLNNNEATLEHEKEATGLSVVESWIVEDVKNDKSNMYDLNAVEGAWCVIMKVDNDKVWDEAQTVKTNVFRILKEVGAPTNQQCLRTQSARRPLQRLQGGANTGAVSILHADDWRAAVVVHEVGTVLGVIPQPAQCHAPLAIIACVTVPTARQQQAFIFNRYARQ